MKVLTILLTFLGLIALTSACEKGEKWCCSSWIGCACAAGKPKSIVNCNKGTKCVMENGNPTCKKRRNLLFSKSVDSTGLPRAALAAAPISADDNAPAFDETAITNVLPRDDSNQISARAAATFCGTCINMPGLTSALTANGFCNNIDVNEQYRACSNQWCGLCILFV